MRLQASTTMSPGVLLGMFDAGGLKPAVAKQYIDKGLRILATSEPIPEHLFVVNTRMSKEKKMRIIDALNNVPIKAYKSIKKSITGVEPVAASDYDNLRKIIKKVDKALPD